MDALKNKLSLNPERSDVLNLNTFGNDQVEKRRCDQVRLQLKAQTRDIEITALSFPKICAPLSTMLDIDQYPHLQGLELADESLLDDTFSDVDILIGSDFYYDIIMGDIRRGDEGPCAVNSEFGWPRVWECEGQRLTIRGDGSKFRNGLSRSIGRCLC